MKERAFPRLVLSSPRMMNSHPNPSLMTDAMDQLKASLQNAPVIWKGDYPYFIHPVTDGVPRMDPSVLHAITELAVDRVDWKGIDLLLGIEAMGLPLTAP